MLFKLNEDHLVSHFDLTTGVWTWPLIMDTITEDRKWKGKKGMGFTVNDLNFL